MSTQIVDEKLLKDAAANTDRFFTVLKSMNEFDKTEVKGVIDTLLNLTDEDNCLVGTYYRTIGNVETLLKLEKAKDYQAIAMLARALFELAVDIRLLQKIPLGWLKMLVHADFEKLRASKKAVEFKKANPDADIDISVYEAYITKNSTKIEGKLKLLWPGQNTPRHWSGLNLDQRAEELKSPFDQIYAVDYARLSWYTHPGITGVVNLPAVVFIHLCGYAFHLAATAYQETLLTMIRKYQISKANDKIEKLLEFAKQLPFTDTPEQVEILRKIATA